MANDQEKSNEVIPSTLAGMNEIPTPDVPAVIVEPIITLPSDDELPPLDGTLNDLLDYAERRYKLVQHYFGKTIHQFYWMGVTFAEIQRQYDLANEGKSKRDPSWLSFEKAAKSRGIPESTARAAADVARAFKSPDKLNGYTQKDAIEVARSLAAPPETPAEKHARLEKQREKAQQEVEATQRLLDAKKANPPANPSTEVAKNVHPKRTAKVQPDAFEDVEEDDDADTVHFLKSIDEIVDEIEFLLTQIPHIDKTRIDMQSVDKAVKGMQDIFNMISALPA